MPRIDGRRGVGGQADQQRRAAGSARRRRPPRPPNPPGRRRAPAPVRAELRAASSAATLIRSGRPCTTATIRAASSTGCSRVSPLARSRTSIRPSARPRPTTTMVGMPRISASVNFTPGLALRSSSSTATPAASSSRRQVGRRRRTSPGPCRWRRSARRTAPARAASTGRARRRCSRPPRPRRGTRPTPYEPMVTVTSLPFSSSTLQAERLGVLAAELEDVAHLDPAGQPQRARSRPVPGRPPGPRRRRSRRPG